MLPPLYATEDERDSVARVKFFTPWAGRTWYSVEFDGDDPFFGLVVSLEKELRYFSLRELESFRGLGGLRVEPDLSFEPTGLSVLTEGKHDH